MIGDDDKSSAGLEHGESLLQEVAQRLDFAVDDYAQSLKHLSQLLLLLARIYERLHYGKELLHSGYGRLLTRLDYCSGNAACRLQLAIEIEGVGKLLLGIIGYLPSGCACGVTVHTHVERAVPTE